MAGFMANRRISTNDCSARQLMASLYIVRRIACFRSNDWPVFLAINKDSISDALQKMAFASFDSNFCIFRSAERQSGVMLDQISGLNNGEAICIFCIYFQAGDES